MRTTDQGFGTASAAKRGRRPEYPYVPIIAYVERAGVNWARTEQIRKRAFVTRQEAVDCAQRVIDNRKADHQRKLADPRYRALRKCEGLPREIAAP